MTDNKRTMPSTVKPHSSLMTRVYDAYVKGGKLTDQEIIQGLAHYRSMADQLVKCGPAFRLAASEANKVADALEGFKNARNI